MANLLKTLNGAVLFLISTASIVVNVPLINFLLRNIAAREDIVSMVMLSLVASGLLCTLTTFACAIVNLCQPTVVPYLVIFFFGNFAHLAIRITMWHLAAMSAMKCYIIVRPLSYPTMLTNRVRNVVIAAIWIAEVIVLFGANLGGVRWVLDPYLYVTGSVGNPTANFGLRTFDIVVGFIASGLIIIVSDVKILFVVRQHHRNVGNVNAGIFLDNQQGSVQGWLASVRSARSLFIMCVAYILAYVPITVVNRSDTVVPLWYKVGVVWLVALTPVANSLLYIILYKSTRRDFVKMYFGRLVVHKESINTVSTYLHHQA